MFGKLMAWGPDRETARRRLIAALGELRVSGLPSTAPYLRDVLGQPVFASGTHSTATLEEQWRPRPDRRPSAAERKCPDGARPGAARTVEIRTNHGPFRVSIHGRPRPPRRRP